jgi:hypothetical protein
VKQAAHILRTAQQWYPNDIRFKETPLYVKHNRAHDGPIRKGDKLYDVPLVRMDGKPVLFIKILDFSCFYPN